MNKENKKSIDKDIDLLIEKLRTFFNDNKKSLVDITVMAFRLFNKIRDDRKYYSVENFDLDFDDVSKDKPFQNEQPKKKFSNFNDIFNALKNDHNQDTANKDISNNCCNDCNKDFCDSIKEKEYFDKGQGKFLPTIIKLVQSYVEENKKNYQIIETMLQTDIFKILLIQYSKNKVDIINQFSFFENNNEWKDGMKDFILTKSLLETIFSTQVSSIAIDILKKNIKEILFFDINQKINYSLSIEELEKRMNDIGKNINKSLKVLVDFLIEKDIFISNPFNKDSRYLSLSIKSYGKKMIELIDYTFSQSENELNNTIYKYLMNSSFLINIEDILYQNIKTYYKFFDMKDEELCWYSKDMVEKFPHFSKMFEYYIRYAERIDKNENPLAIQKIRSSLLFLISTDISNIYLGKEFILSDLRKELEIIANAIVRFFTFSHNLTSENIVGIENKYKIAEKEKEMFEQIKSIKKYQDPQQNLVPDLFVIR